MNDTDVEQALRSTAEGWQRHVPSPPDLRQLLESNQPPRRQWRRLAAPVLSAAAVAALVVGIAVAVAWWPRHTAVNAAGPRDACSADRGVATGSAGLSDDDVALACAIGKRAAARTAALIHGRPAPINGRGWPVSLASASAGLEAGSTAVGQTHGDHRCGAGGVLVVRLAGNFNLLVSPPLGQAAAGPFRWVTVLINVHTRSQCGVLIPARGPTRLGHSVVLYRANGRSDGA